ncbi:MAG: DUF4129 domain-containing protein, partial [Acidimicrobiia bacterium]|nr:DUF4129 domain-containing protein [Acidimicrobiia bacterium]
PAQLEDFVPFPIPGGGGDEDVVASPGFTLPSWVPIAGSVAAVIAVLMGAIPALKWWARRRRMRRLLGGDISAAWEEMVKRLTDLGDSPDPTETPHEIAEAIDESMTPLAVVYSRATYGPTSSATAAEVALVEQSLEQTTAKLATRYSPTQRLVAVYRPGTILPSWWKKLRNRRRSEG